MKHSILIKVILGSLLISLLFGCKRFDNREPITEKGKSIFNSWSDGMMHTFNNYIDIVFKFNHYYEAPDSQKESIKNQLFSKYNISKINDDEWTLSHAQGYSRYTIKKNGKTLSEKGAQWSIQQNKNHQWGSMRLNLNHYSDYSFFSFYDTNTVAYLNCEDNGKWSVQISENSSPKSELTLKISTSDLKTPVIPSQENITLTGNGTFAYFHRWYEDHENKIASAFITFTINEEMLAFPQKDNNIFQNGQWSSGSIFLHAFNLKGDENNTSASFSFSEGDYRTYIQYKGYTECWVDNYYRPSL